MCQKHVQPEDAGIDHLLQHQGGKVPERDRMIHSAHSFFHGPNKAFKFRNMLIIHTDVMAGPRTGKGRMQGLKFTIGMYHVYKKTAGPIYAHHASQSLRNSILLVV